MTMIHISPLCFDPIQWWDIGKGFKIPEVYRTGYTVIGLSIVTSIALACL